MSATASKPHILLVSLGFDFHDFFGLYHHLWKKLSAVAVLDHVIEPESAIRGSADQPPQAVLVTGGSISKHPHVYAQLLNYVRSGGTLVLMGNFSASIAPQDMEKLFEKAGLPWKQAGCFRTTVHLNHTEQTSPHASLLPNYSQKAVFLSSVANKDAWYLPTDSSRLESLVLASEPITDQTQTPIALANIGKGKFGFVGDTNGGEESDLVVLAMCGLLDNA